MAIEFVLFIRSPFQSTMRLHCSMHFVDADAGCAEAVAVRARVNYATYSFAVAADAYR